MSSDIIQFMQKEGERINAKLNQELMDRYPFKAVQDAQETQREGWMPDPVAELNQRLIDRQESFQAQLVRIEDTWREKLRDAVAETNIYINQVTEAVRQVEASDALNRNLLVENRAKDAEIDRLKKELGEAKRSAFLWRDAKTDPPKLTGWYLVKIHGDREEDHAIIRVEEGFTEYQTGELADPDEWQAWAEFPAWINPEALTSQRQ